VPSYTRELSKYKDTKERLIENMRSTTGVGARHFDVAKAILDVKGQEEIANQTSSLTKATRILAGATIALVVATILLVYVTIYH
jgi:hypothetical protein